MSKQTIDAPVPQALAPLLSPARYKGAYGGRGSGKSHFFAEELILRCMERQTRWACVREVQATIKDSVRQLLIDKISKFGLGAHFDVREAEIRCPHNGLIVFKGMQAYNAENIKSLEDFDGAWVEEAQTFSERSLRMLRPTIRKPGSELWFSWNPRHDTDAVDAFFRGGKLPPDAVVVECNHRDNPWFPEVLLQEKAHDFDADPEMAEHVWNGGYELVSEAAYFARLISAAEKEDRVNWFPPLRGVPVMTAWDIGVDDYTAIWFVQRDDYGFRVVDFFEASDMGAEEILRTAMPEYSPDIGEAAAALIELNRPPFDYADHFLPHDVAVREWGAGARKRAETLTHLGMPARLIRRGVATNPADRIAAARALLPQCRFHRSDRVMHGLKRLRRYSRKRNEALGTYGGPLHDENSHAADAFGELAVNMAPTRVPRPAPEKATPQPGQVALGPPEPQRRRVRV